MVQQALRIYLGETVPRKRQPTAARSGGAVVEAVAAARRRTCSSKASWGWMKLVLSKATKMVTIRSSTKAGCGDGDRW